jgi:hypothetical protein
MTGGETTLLAAAVGGGAAVLAAAGAAFTTYKVTNRSITAQRENEREKRPAEAYIDLLMLIHVTMVKVKTERPSSGMADPTPEEMSEITPTEEARIKARVQAVGSAPVRNKLQTVARYTRRVSASARASGRAGGRGQPRPEGMPAKEWAALMQDMNERREGLRDITVELEEAIQCELTSKGDDREILPVQDPAKGSIRGG